MRRDRDALYDIVDAALLILGYTRGMDEEQFCRSTVTQDAVIRRFEIIGEATKRLSPAFRKTHPTIPWDEMAGMRDRVIHGYDTVDWSIVWKAVRESLPRLVTDVEAILAEMPNADE